MLHPLRGPRLFTTVAVIAACVGLGLWAAELRAGRTGAAPGTSGSPDVSWSAPARVAPAGPQPAPQNTIPAPPVPRSEPPRLLEDPDVVAGRRLHPDGHSSDYVHIPLHAGRSASYEAYRWPLGLELVRVLDGYDLGLSPERLRRAPASGEIGHGGIDFAADAGTPLWLVPLENQAEAPEVLFVGRLFGSSVVTLHTVRERGSLVRYLVLLGHLSHVPDGLRRGLRLHGSRELGRVGDSGSPGKVHLHLETRRVRREVDPWSVPARALMRPAASIVCDPRNVFPPRRAWSNGARSPRP